MKSLRKSQTKEFKTSKMSEIVYLKFKADRRNLQISRIQFFITNFKKVTRKRFSPKVPHVRHKLRDTHFTECLKEMNPQVKCKVN